MKILFAPNRFPYPPFRGDNLKNFYLAKNLSKHHELHLLSFIQSESDLQYLSELKKVYSEVHLVPLPRIKSILNCIPALISKQPIQNAFFHTNKMGQAINALLSKNHYDAVHIQHLRMAQYWHDKKIPRILDLPDAYSLYWKRRVATLSGIKKQFSKIECKRVDDYEKIINHFDKVLVCSTEDKKYLLQKYPNSPLGLLPNGVDLENYKTEQHDYSLHTNLLFTGNMEYAPNVDAVAYFTKEIFPIILQQIPNAQCIIAGQKPTKKVLELANDKVEVTGFVEDLNPYYRNASIVISPLRFGAGTQYKILTAMAMGIPVVSHHIGFEGLGIASGNGTLLTKDAPEFADACIRLLQSEALRKEVGEKGRTIINEQFDCQAVAKQLENYIFEIIKK